MTRLTRRTCSCFALRAARSSKLVAIGIACDTWHKDHGKPRHGRACMDHCAAVLRCLFTRLPLARIKESSRDKKSKSMEAFALRYCAKLCDETAKAFQWDDVDKTCLWIGLRSWLGVMATINGDGKRIALGWRPGTCRFAWEGFYLEDEDELSKITASAIAEWQDANFMTA